MERTAVGSVWQKVKKLIVYTPPATPSRFVLDETVEDDRKETQAKSTRELEGDYQEAKALLRSARRILELGEQTVRILRQNGLAGNIQELKAKLYALEKQQKELIPILLAYDSDGEIEEERQLSVSLEENRSLLEKIYRIPKNKDVVIRELEIGTEPKAKAAAFFIDGMVDTKVMNLTVLQPLMLASFKRPMGEEFIGMLVNSYLPANQARRVNSFGEVQEGINSGDTVLLFDGIPGALLVGTKGWEHRGVSRPSSEQSVFGAQVAFSENIRVNTALIRTTLKDSNLVTEMIKIGKRSQINCALMYLADLANPQLVAEVGRRLKSIRTDYISETGTLLQFIEDHPKNPFPQSISTERLDRVGVHLSEGRVAIVMEGNPFVHILPVSFFSFFHSAEDFGMKSIVGNFMRVLRLFGTLIATVLPSLYIAIAYYHQEAIPTDLLLAIAGSRENVPFPAIFEVIIMEISFELLREAGVRIPGLLGSTIGIVGAIILGQAAVAAKIVSPIVVVVIAITGLASFTIPEYRMASAVRLIRFLLLAFASTMGLVGLGTGLLWLTVVLAGMKSFGMPYMTPVAPKTIAGFDVVFRGEVFEKEARPDELSPLDSRRQSVISRKWITDKPVKGDETK